MDRRHVMKEKIKLLNEIKQKLILTGNSFKREYLHNALKEKSFTMVDALIREFLEKGILVKQNKVTMSFTNNEPIYIGVLEDSYKKLREKNAEMSRHYYNSYKSTVEGAIALLKKEGYKILKPTTTFEEI